MRQNNNNLTISERDKRAIFIISRLTEKELFGVECYLAGTRAAGRAAGSQSGNRQQAKPQGVAV